MHTANESNDPFELAKADYLALRRISNLKVSKVPKPLGTSNTVRSALGAKKKLYGIRADHGKPTSGRVAGMRTNSAMEGLRSTMKKNQEDPFEIVKSKRQSE